MRLLRGLGLWLVILPIVLVILLATGQLALAFARPPTGADTRSRLDVDYRPWPLNLLFQPVDPAILTDVFRDEQRLAAASGTAMLPGQDLSLDALLVTSTLTSSATSQPPTTTPTPRPTNTRPRPTFTLPPSATATFTASAMPSVTASSTAPPPPPPPDTPAPIPTQTPTDTATPTITPTVTNTPIPGFNLGSPDGSVADIAVGGSMTVNLGVTPLVTGHGGNDFVYYENFVTACCVITGTAVITDGILMDWVIVDVSTDNATWVTVFTWGVGSGADGNITLSSNGYYGAYGTAELENEQVPAAYLIANSGIGIDIDSLGIPAGTYPYMRVSSPGTATDPAQVNSIEIVP